MTGRAVREQRQRQQHPGGRHDRSDADRQVEPAHEGRPGIGGQLGAEVTADTRCDLERTPE